MFLLLISTTIAGPIYDQTQSAPAIIWAGVDYSKARFFVPETFNNPEEITFFNPGGGLRDAVRRYEKPDDAWGDLVKEWNTMLQNDLVEDMEKVIMRDLVIDLPNEAGQTTGKKEPFFESQYEAKNNPMNLDMTAIGDMVKKYKLKSKEGLGLVFIYERGSQVDELACMWPTWFDAKTKQVIQTARTCEKPGGQGFRNFWYTPMLDIGKDIIKTLKKHEI